MNIVGNNFEMLLDSVLTCLVVEDLLEGLEVVVFEAGELPEELLEGLPDELLEDGVTQIPVPFIPSSHIPLTQEQGSLQFGPK